MQVSTITTNSIQRKVQTRRDSRIRHFIRPLSFHLLQANLLMYLQTLPDLDQDDIEKLDQYRPDQKILKPEFRPWRKNFRNTESEGLGVFSKVRVNLLFLNNDWCLCYFIYSFNFNNECQIKKKTNTHYFQVRLHSTIAAFRILIPPKSQFLATIQRKRIPCNNVCMHFVHKNSIHKFAWQGP